MRTLSLSMLCLVWLSCAMDERDEGGSAEGTQSVASRQDALSTPPTSLTGYRWGTPLFPSTVRSAYVVIVEHPTDTTRFVAWGFDLVSNRTHFFVTGEKRTDRPRLVQQVEHDISIPVQVDLDFTFGLANQQGKKGPGGPPSPPGGNDWTAYNNYGHDIAMKVQQAHLQAF